MLAKIFILVVMAAILLSLGSGLYFLVNDKGEGTRTVKALSIRIGLSLTLFIILFAGFALGIIHPHGMTP